MLTLLTSRQNRLPAPSVSAHMPLPCRVALTAGGDDGENLGSRRGVDPEESERQTEAERSPEPAATGGCQDNPSDLVLQSLLHGADLGRGEGFSVLLNLL